MYCIRGLGSPSNIDPKLTEEHTLISGGQQGHHRRKDVRDGRLHDASMWPFAHCGMAKLLQVRDAILAASDFPGHRSCVYLCLSSRTGANGAREGVLPRMDLRCALSSQNTRYTRHDVEGGNGAALHCCGTFCFVAFERVGDVMSLWLLLPGHMHTCFLRAGFCLDVEFIKHQPKCNYRLVLGASPMMYNTRFSGYMFGRQSSLPIVAPAIRGI